jgi:hypothetical protein
MDDNKNKRLEFDEFAKGVIEYGLSYTKAELKDLFDSFDKDHSGNNFKQLVFY